MLANPIPQNDPSTAQHPGGCRREPRVPAAYGLSRARKIFSIMAVMKSFGLEAGGAKKE